MNEGCVSIQDKLQSTQKDTSEIKSPEIDSLNRIRINRYRIYYYSQLNNYLDSFSELKSSLSFLYYKDSSKISTWSSHSQIVRLKKDTILGTTVSNKNPEVVEQVKEKTKIEKFAEEVYESKLKNVLPIFYSKTIENIFFYLLIFLIFSILIVQVFLNRYKNKLFEFLNRLFMGSMKYKIREVPIHHYFQNLIFNFIYIISISTTVITSLFYLNFLKVESTNHWETFIYIALFFTTAYILRYIYIFLISLFTYYRNFKFFLFLNFYFNKLIGIILLPLLIILILLREVSYRDYVYNIFVTILFILLVIKSFYLFRIAISKVIQNKFLFFIFYLFAESFNLLFFATIFILPKTNFSFIEKIVTF